MILDHLSIAEGRKQHEVRGRRRPRGVFIALSSVGSIVRTVDDTDASSRGIAEWEPLLSIRTNGAGWNCLRFAFVSIIQQYSKFCSKVNGSSVKGTPNRIN